MVSAHRGHRVLRQPHLRRAISYTPTAVFTTSLSRSRFLEPAGSGEGASPGVLALRETTGQRHRHQPQGQPLRLLGDMLMTIAPGMLLTISVTFNAIIIALAAAGLACPRASWWHPRCRRSASPHELHGVHVHAFGVLTTFVEWDSIHSTTGKKIRYMFTFPFFMLTYVPSRYGAGEEVQLEAHQALHQRGRAVSSKANPAATSA